MESLDNLQRKLSLFPATNIVVANMIGAGIFTTSGLLLAELNDPKVMLLLWIVGGILAICGALSYGELGAAMPGAGGEYYFLSRLYHPIFGFLSGWVSFIVGFSAPIAASAMGFSEYFCRAFPRVPRWFYNNWTQSVLCDGKRWITLQVCFQNPSKVPGSFEFDSSSMSYRYYPRNLRNI